MSRFIVSVNGVKKCTSWRIKKKLNIHTHVFVSTIFFLLFLQVGLSFLLRFKIMFIQYGIMTSYRQVTYLHSNVHIISTCAFFFTNYKHLESLNNFLFCHWRAQIIPLRLDQLCNISVRVFLLNNLASSISEETFVV